MHNPCVIYQSRTWNHKNLTLESSISPNFRASPSFPENPKKSDRTRFPQKRQSLHELRGNEGKKEEPGKSGTDGKSQSWRKTRTLTTTSLKLIEYHEFEDPGHGTSLIWTFNRSSLNSRLNRKQIKKKWPCPRHETLNFNHEHTRHANNAKAQLDQIFQLNRTPMRKHNGKKISQRSTKYNSYKEQS